MKRQLIWVVALVLAASPVFAQTFGRITGQILDTSGSAVPGVAVTVTSPSLQGSLTSTTDGSGNFRFPSVPPGNYKVRAELAGFKIVEQSNVAVGIDRTMTLAFKMEVAALSETVTVEGASVIDVATTTTGINATPELFNRLAMPRDVYSVTRVAAGVGDDGQGPTFFGSSGAENQYIIDGINTTGIELGTKGKTINFDFVEEIEIKTGGLPAEFGRMTGGVVNVLTKSGGNQFRGSVFGFFEGAGLQSDNSTAADRPNTTTTVFDIDQKWDFGAELGGYLVKDKLWFFGAYNRVGETDNTTVIRTLTAPGSPALGSVIPADINSNLYSAKLTAKLGPNHTLIGTIFGDPTTREGNVFAIAGPESTWKGTRDTGGTDFAAKYDGVLSPSFLVRAAYGQHKEKSIFGGPGKTINQLLNQTVSPSQASGGFAFYQDQNFSRDMFQLNFTKFLGTHEFKLGGDMEKVQSEVARNYGGGSLIYALRQASTGRTYYRHRYFVNDRAAGFDRNNPATWQIANPLVSEPGTDNFSAFLQDSWKIGSSFTLNLGVRWERQHAKDRDDNTAFDLKQNWAPRLGFVWDPSRTGKSKLYANYARFFENIPQDINIRAFGGEVLCFCYNFSPSPSATAPDPAAPSRSSLLGGSEPVDPDLKGQYINEYLLGYEREVGRNFVMGIKGRYRNLGRVIEDFLIPSEGNYFIANPGVGLGSELAFYDGVSTAPSPKAERKSWNVELTATKRFADNWQFLASYVFGKLDGNYDGLFQNSTGQLDPNINSAFDYADFLVNAEGPLSVDLRHAVKLDGSYQFKGGLDGLNLGLSAHWFSGVPQNAYGYSFAYANWEYYLAPRGSVGRHPSDYEADLHISYPIKLGDKSRLNLVADIFNIFDRQAAIQQDERYNLALHGACGGVPEEICNGDGGLLNIPNTVNPAGSIPNPKATAVNPDYLQKGIAFTGQRSIRLGVRLQF